MYQPTNGKGNSGKKSAMPTKGVTNLACFLLLTTHSLDDEDNPLLFERTIW